MSAATIGSLVCAASFEHSSELDVALDLPEHLTADRGAESFAGRFFLSGGWCLSRRSWFVVKHGKTPFCHGGSDQEQTCEALQKRDFWPGHFIRGSGKMQSVLSSVSLYSANRHHRLSWRSRLWRNRHQ